MEGLFTFMLFSNENDDSNNKISFVIIFFYFPMIALKI